MLEIYCELDFNTIFQIYCRGKLWKEPTLEYIDTLNFNHRKEQITGLQNDKTKITM